MFTKMEKRVEIRRRVRNGEIGRELLRLGVLFSLDSLDFTTEPTINKVLVGELMRREYIDGRENILLVDNSGTGKTHLVVSLGGCRLRSGQANRLS